MACALALAGCSADREPPPGQPAFYISMANPNAQLDSQVAASMISGYRQNNGLSAVTVDPVLTQAAKAQAEAMARRNKLDHDVIGGLGKMGSKFGNIDCRERVQADGNTGLCCPVAQDSTAFRCQSGKRCRPRLQAEIHIAQTVRCGPGESVL